jgi:hypothetical protein
MSASTTANTRPVADSKYMMLAKLLVYAKLKLAMNINQFRSLKSSAEDPDMDPYPDWIRIQLGP